MTTKLDDSIFECSCGNPKVRVRGLGLYCRDCDDDIFSPSSKEELTNGGKPHMCNTLQVFNGGKDSVSLCTKCNMPVDSSKEGEWANEWVSPSVLSLMYETGGLMNIAKFIHQNFISKHSLIKKIEGMRQPLVTEDMPPMSYAYNQALDNLLIYLKGEDNEK